MTAVHTITLRCDGDFQKGCPSSSAITLETNSNGEARYEAGLSGWSWQWGLENMAANNTRKKIDVCPQCGPRRRTR